MILLSQASRPLPLLFPCAVPVERVCASRSHARQYPTRQQHLTRLEIPLAPAQSDSPLVPKPYSTPFAPASLEIPSLPAPRLFPFVPSLR